MTGKLYSGRLAFDPETNFHTDQDGKPVITTDGGLTWRYAEEGDASHFDRYHEKFAGVDGTANLLMDLQLEHGRDRAEEIMRDEHPHHYEVQPDDEHFVGVRSIPDNQSARQTGHTEAWKDA